MARKKTKSRVRLAIKMRQESSKLIGATPGGRKKVEVNPTTKLSRAIHGDKGILLTKTNYACPESWLRGRATKFEQVETRLKIAPKYEWLN